MPSGATRLVLLFTPEGGGWGQRQPRAGTDQHDGHNRVHLDKAARGFYSVSAGGVAFFVSILWVVVCACR